MTTLKFLHFFFVFFVVAAPTSQSLRAFFDVTGSVYPHGVFHAVMKVGYPAKEYHLTLDTGSSLTWLECKHANPTGVSGYVPDDSKFVRKYNPKSKSMEKCRYFTKYADGSSMDGFQIRDNFHLFDPETRSSQQVALIFGCGSLESNREREPLTDGLLGLGNGRSSIVNQMKDEGIIEENMVGHCLSRHGTGYAFIGGSGVLPLSRDTVWLDMDTSRVNEYVVGTVTIVLDGHPTRKFKYQDVIFDSASTYTHFTTSVYDSTVEMVKRSLTNSPLSLHHGPVGLFDHCWEREEPIYRVGQVRDYFRPIKLEFRHGEIITLEPEDYLQIHATGRVCLGIKDAAKSDYTARQNVIGDISMMDKLVVYDNENGQLGWDKHADCQQSYKYVE